MHTPVTATSRRLLDRRGFLHDCGTAAAGIGLAHLLARDGLLAAPAPPIRPAIDATHPYAARPPHFTAKADRLLVIFCAGAVSHIDTWDYKPSLYRHDGEQPPDAPAVTFQGPIGRLAKPFWTFRPRGESGKMVSDLDRESPRTLAEYGATADDPIKAGFARNRRRRSRHAAFVAVSTAAARRRGDP